MDLILENEFSSIEDANSQLSRSTAQFRSIERMRDSLINFERNHKLKTTMQEFHRIKWSIDLEAKGKYNNGQRKSQSPIMNQYNFVVKHKVNKSKSKLKQAAL